MAGVHQPLPSTDAPSDPTLAGILSIVLLLPTASAARGYPTCGVTDSSKNFTLLFCGYGAIENCSAYLDVLNGGAVLGGWQKVDTTYRDNEWLGLMNSHSEYIHHRCRYAWPDGGRSSRTVTDKTGGLLVPGAVQLRALMCPHSGRACRWLVLLMLTVVLTPVLTDSLYTLESYGTSDRSTNDRSSSVAPELRPRLLLALPKDPLLMYRATLIALRFTRYAVELANSLSP